MNKLPVLNSSNKDHIFSCFLRSLSTSSTTENSGFSIPKLAESCLQVSRINTTIITWQCIIRCGKKSRQFDPYISFCLVCKSSSHSCLFSRRILRLFVRTSGPPSWRLVSRGFSCSHRNWNFSTSLMKFSICVIRLLLIPSTYKDQFDINICCPCTIL